MMAGANPAAVQRILRHSDPRLTTERYGHLAPNYLRAEVDRLNFGSFVPSLSPGANPETTEAGSTEEISQRIRPLIPERRTGFEPATPSLGRSCEVPWFRQLGGSAGCRTRNTRMGEQDARAICIRNASAAGPDALRGRLGWATALARKPGA